MMVWSGFSWRRWWAVVKMLMRLDSMKDVYLYFLTTVSFFRKDVLTCWGVIVMTVLRVNTEG